MLTVEEARRLKKISIRDMAKMLKMSPTTYSLKEKGTRKFYVDEAIAFCQAVNMHIGDIIFL